MAKTNSVGKAKENSAAYDHIVKYIGLFGGVQGLILLISVLRNKVAACFLGASGIGLINIYNRVVGLINQATNLGISFSAVKHVAELADVDDKARLNELVATVRAWSLMTAVLGVFVGVAMSPLLSWWTFKNYGYTHTFCILSLVVAMMTITGGEIAILKGLKQLKKVAVISVFAALATLLVCVPLYYIWGIGSVLWSLVLSNAAVLAIHLHYSTMVVPWSAAILKIKRIKDGVPMARLGLAFVLAGILGQGADYLIVSFIQNDAGLDSVGLYNAGYFLAVNIGSLLFVKYKSEFLASGETSQFFADARDIFPQYIKNHIPAGVRGLMITGLLAAALSSFNSAINAMASSFVTDLYLPIRADKGKAVKGDAEQLSSSRKMVFLMGMLLTGFAIVTAVMQEASGLNLVDFATGVMCFAYAGMIGVFLTAIFTKRGNTASVVAAIVVGALIIIPLMFQKQLFGGQYIAWTWWAPIGGTISTIVCMLGKPKSK